MSSKTSGFCFGGGKKPFVMSQRALKSIVRCLFPFQTWRHNKTSVSAGKKTMPLPGNPQIIFLKLLIKAAPLETGVRRTVEGRSETSPMSLLVSSFTCVMALQSMLALPMNTCFLSTIQNLLCRTPPARRPKLTFLTRTPFKTKTRRWWCAAWLKG